MSYLFIALLLLAALHYMYEGMIAPTLRLKYRYRLFTIRDSLHTIKLIDSKNKKALKIIESGIDHMIDRMDSLSFFGVLSAKKVYNKNKKIKREMDNIRSILDGCTNEELKKIDKDLYKIGMKILAVNSGGWLIYIVPIYLISSTIAKFVGSVYEYMSKLKTITAYSVQDYTFMSEKSFDKIPGRSNNDTYGIA